MFTALLLEKTDEGFSHQITELAEDQLPEREVTVAVDYSTVNYKDGLAICNGAPVVRNWPLVPGIDLAGVVETSTHPDWQPGDRVTVNGWDLGEKHWGGMAQKARVDAAWLTRLPEGIDTRAAAAIGTAGYTAMLCVLTLEDHGIAPRRRTGDRDGCRRRRGQRVGGPAGEIGLPGGGIHRTGRHRRRLPTFARRGGNPGPQRVERVRRSTNGAGPGGRPASTPSAATHS